MSGLPGALEDSSWPPDSQHGSHWRLQRRQPGRPPIAQDATRALRARPESPGALCSLEGRAPEDSMSHCIPGGGASVEMEGVVLSQQSRLRHHWPRCLALGPSRQPIAPSALHRAHCHPGRLVSTLGDVTEKATNEEFTGKRVGPGGSARRGPLSGRGDPQDTRRRPAPVQSTRHHPVAIKQSRERHSVAHVLNDVEITWQETP